MQRRFDLLIFDWDGTLSDSADTIAFCIRAACADIGLPVPSEEEAKHIIGLGLKEAMAVLMPGLPEGDNARLAARYRHYWFDREPAIPLFPGVAETLPRLRDEGFLLAVATGKSRRGLDAVLARTGLGPLFHTSRCADESQSKPEPHMVEEIIAELGTEPGRSLVIGDTTHDLLMARNAGVAALAVCYGAHPSNSLRDLGALACLEDFPAVAAWLEANA